MAFALLIPFGGDQKFSLLNVRRHHFDGGFFWQSALGGRARPVSGGGRLFAPDGDQEGGGLRFAQDDRVSSPDGRQEHQGIISAVFSHGVVRLAPICEALRHTSHYKKAAIEMMAAKV